VTTTVMDARRKRWYAALTIFFLWVAALGAMAVVSGRAPTDRPREGGNSTVAPAVDGSGRRGGG
jgi:hypothetical protein